MADAGLVWRVRDELADQQRLVADAILLERASRVLVRRFGDKGDACSVVDKLVSLATIFRVRAGDEAAG